ncbi:hypothetical protein K1719_026088 [Acacia pycnantha]|nr:hypothetical protein K1719_026088 [Acacia pycnantha]
MGCFTSKSSHPQKVVYQFEEEKKKIIRPNRSICSNWRQFSGENHWEGLLDPLDVDLRRYIIHYGEIDVPTYGDVEESNWIGYVAVATDEGKAVLGRRDIVISWRGTNQIMEWIKDFQFFLATNPSFFNKASVRNQVLAEIRRLLDKFKDEEISITVTGHSLGAALAILNAVDIVSIGFNIQEDDESQKACPVTAFVFASLRVGDSHFHEIFSAQKDLRTLRIRNREDIVQRLPILHFAEVGEELEINTQKSNFLKHSGSYKVLHNLEVYLHGVAGTQGKKEGFKDIALVNKNLGVLKDEYHIPKSWRIDQNKGLVQQPDGTWKLQDPDSEEDDFIGQ